MAGPPNPFAGLSQKDGTIGTVGRGRGGTLGRSAPYQAKNGNAPHNPRVRGRGRGAMSAPRVTRGHARGGGAVGNTWRKPDSNGAPSANSASPFAQLKQNGNQPSPSPFAEKAAPQKSSFPGFGKAPSFGAPSTFDGTQVDSSRDPRKRPSSIRPNGATMSSVPVEDAIASNNYNDRYEQLKLDRAKQREKAIREGQMADPNQPTSLNQAITPVGTCTSMCPEFERVERIVQKMVDKSEKLLHPSTNSLQNLETKMLKRFRRSAAGYDEQLPSDIRTPKTLLQTMNYLIRHVIGGPEPLGLIHKFVWDRTRSIRNDFSVQQLTQEEHVKMAVTCLERIARFHIVSLHLLSSPANEEPFDHHQEREQLNNTMLSLMYYYDDNRGRISFPNEDEFRAYYIIFSILDQRPDLEARVQKWPAELRNSPRVQLALELLAAAGNGWEYQGTLDSKRQNAIAQGFYERFFSLVDSPAVSYLMACVAEIYFNNVRLTAIRSIWKGYCRYPSSQQHKNEEWTVDELTRVLYFDNPEQTIKFCEEQDLEFAENANGDLYLNWGNRNIDSVGMCDSRR
ncbi:SAC3/GANP/Nin1/mts3/eIF-3 p25 family-domain-containing protein [Aspergillus tamarii]|uniref:SAC3/GANP/Nin1/mts3/eIF-3 p25 family-domain-containing protein n=1 Tax=Aspergillus tamarii TaxID=41984 RepID=A0A5N6USR7_ASPTM|nr:SAC3/GANP/Nin1/mts3/eIF-3 p25 family-domain-containing protein [Aspergillus tamarii]